MNSTRSKLLWRIVTKDGTFYANAVTARRAGNKVSQRIGPNKCLSVTAIADGDDREGAWQLPR